MGVAVRLFGGARRDGGGAQGRRAGACAAPAGGVLRGRGTSGRPQHPAPRSAAYGCQTGATETGNERGIGGALSPPDTVAIMTDRHGRLFHGHIETDTMQAMREDPGFRHGLVIRPVKTGRITHQHPVLRGVTKAAGWIRKVGSDGWVAFWRGVNIEGTSRVGKP